MIEGSEMIRRLVLPMVEERSREPGDAWDQAAKYLAALASPPAVADGLVERLQALDCVMVEICEPHPGNPSANIIPVPLATLLAALSPVPASASDAELIARLRKVVDDADYPGGFVNGADQLALDDVRASADRLEALTKSPPQERALQEELRKVKWALDETIRTETETAAEAFNDGIEAAAEACEAETNYTGNTHFATLIRALAIPGVPAKAEQPQETVEAIIERCAKKQRSLLKHALEAIESGRSEPLFIMRDAIRNWLEDNPEPALKLEQLTSTQEREG